MMPGRILHRVAAYLCSHRSLDRVVEPAIADLQREYAHAATARGRVSSLASGYFSVLKVIAVCAIDLSDATSDDRRAVMRTVAWWLTLTCAIVALLSVPWLWTYPIAIKYPYLAMTLLPQAAPLAIPVGLAFALALCLRRPVTLNAGRMILIAAAIASLSSFGILAWALPASNQVFRDFVFQTVRAQGYSGPMNGLQKGANEMRLAELRSEIHDAAASGENSRARRFAWAYHSRFAIAASTLVLAVFFLTLPVQHPLGRALIALAACFNYWMLLYVGEFAITTGYLTPFAGAWLPNIALVVAALLVLSVRSRCHPSVMLRSG